MRDLRAAVTARSGFAAGKLGGSERVLLRYPLVDDASLGRHARLALELQVREHGLYHAGIFPGTAGYLRRYAGILAQHARSLDYVGVFLDRADAAEERVLLRHYDFPGRAIYYREQEPECDATALSDACYLDAFAGKRLLLLSPFAEFLAARARPEVFEAVWAAAGRRWFAPASVEGVEHPYGFLPATWERHVDAEALIEAILAGIVDRSFDVALIAAGGIAIPLAVRLKRMGKVAISLGGHLQALFGVLGRRWRQGPFHQRYVNDAWVDVPQRYRPADRDRFCSGDYW